MLRRRLRAVTRAAVAASAANAGAPAVHRLRVATRRATAGLVVFRELIPRRWRQRIKKDLRRMRRAAGEARDLDVLIARGRGESTATRASIPARRLADLLAVRRPETRRQLQGRLAALPTDGWEAVLTATVAAVADRKSADTAASFARRRMRRLVRRFLARLDERLHTGRAIHRLRIETKKLRYALELTTEIAPPASTVAPNRMLRDLQDRFGEYTDRAAAAERLGRWARRESDGHDRHTLLAARDREATAAKRARRACERWWTRARRRRVGHRLERLLGGLPG